MTGRTTSEFSAPPKARFLTDHRPHPTMIALPGWEAIRESASSPSPRAFSTLILDPGDGTQLGRSCIRLPLALRRLINSP